MSHRTRLSLDAQWLFSPTKILDTDNCSLIAVPSPWQADPRFRNHIGQAWYQREFEIPDVWLEPGRVMILGFGAVDYFAEVWLNGIKVGEHEGGYLPFELDVTTAARAGENVLTVRVDDPLELFAEIPHGKQSWYGMLSGIWQPVWIESRAASNIQRVRISTDAGKVSVEVYGCGDFMDGLTAEVFDPLGVRVAQAKPVEARFALEVAQPMFWSPDEPNLYTLKVCTWSDEVTENFGFRTITARDGRILLNGRPFYLRGALDQDYYPDLISTPPSQEYIEDQFRKAKEMGLNCLRVHIKVADPRYYAAADKVGLLIWTELPNHGILTGDARCRARETLAGMLERDGNHPSIGIWTIINESWGIDLTDPSQRAWLLETYLWLKDLDPTRLVVGNSACWSNFHVVTDIADFHNYYAMPDHYEKWQKWTKTYASRPWWLFAHEYTEHASWREFARDPWYTGERPQASDVKAKGDEPLLVSEFGNWGLPNVEKLYQGNGGSAPWWFDTGLEWSDGVVYPRGIEQRFRDYHLDRVFPSLAALTEASQRLQLEALKFQIEDMRAHAGLQGYVITELTDVHWESNGLLDMNRNPKLHFPLLKMFNADDVLIPQWDRLVYSAGETCSLKISFSHYAPVQVKSAELLWEIISNESTGVRGQAQVGECTLFGLTELGTVSFEAPLVESPSQVRFRVNLVDGGNLIASAEQEFYVFPEMPAFAHGQPVFAPELRGPLERLGFSITEDLSQARVAVVTVLDDTYREFILRGGRVLLLAESAEAIQVHIAGMNIKEREKTPWQGDWASCFGWHRFENLPTGGTVNFAFAGLTPEYIICDFSPRDFAFDVYAGMFVGWLHKPVPTIARRRAGHGQVLMSTFRLTNHLEDNPLAKYLFAELMKLVNSA